VGGLPVPVGRAAATHRLGFSQENESGKISLVAWTAAFAFEASIAALMHKLSGHIDRTPRRQRAGILA